MPMGVRHSDGEESPVIVTTGNDIAGHEIVEVIGPVFGLTVRSRHIGTQIGAALKSLVGGELAGVTKTLVESRDEAMGRMIEAAADAGADGILAMRFDAASMGDLWAEICAYGTAVRLAPAT